MKLDVEDQYNTFEVLTKDVVSESLLIADLKQELSKIVEELQQASVSHQENLSKHTNSLRLAETDITTVQAEADQLTKKLESLQESLASAKKESEAATAKREELRLLLTKQENDFQAEHENISQQIQDAYNTQEDVNLIIQNCTADIKKAEQEIYLCDQVKISVNELQLEYDSMLSENAEKVMELQAQLNEMNESVNILEAESS